MRKSIERKVIEEDSLSSLDDVPVGAILQINTERARDRRRSERGLVVEKKKFPKRIVVYTKNKIPEAERDKYVGGLLEVHYALGRKGLKEKHLQSFHLFDNGFNPIYDALKGATLL